MSEHDHDYGMTCIHCAGQDLNTEISRRVRELGWMVMLVGNDGDPYTYTVGLALHGLPELYAEPDTPIELREAGATLNYLARIAIAGEIQLRHQQVVVDTDEPHFHICMTRMNDLARLSEARRCAPFGITALRVDVHDHTSSSTM